MALANMDVRVTTSGKNLETYLKTVEQSFSKDRLFRDLEAIKRKVLNETDTYIKEKRKRPESVNTEDRWRTTAQRNLINTLKAGTWIEQTRTNRFRLGIGEQRFLDKHAKYWKLINYGGKIDMKGKEFVPGYFGRGIAPGMGTKQTFKYTGALKGTNIYRPLKKGGPGYSYRMIPKKPIAPMRYLSKMAEVFSREMKNLEVDYRRRIRARQRL